MTGFSMKPSKPALMIFCRSCCMTEAVIATTGIAAVAGSARSAFNASMPLMPGSWMSIRIRSGFRSRAIFSPSSPLPASTVW